MSGGGEERVDEQQGAVAAWERVVLGTVTVRVEDAGGVREQVSQPETASESAGADATGNTGV